MNCAKESDLKIYKTYVDDDKEIEMIKKKTRSRKNNMKK